MPAQIVPLDTSPNQNFQIALSVDGATLTLQLTIRYNEMASLWMMTIRDSSGNLLLDSVPMVTGDFPAGNLLQQHGYLKIGSAYIINVSGGTSDRPDATNLGTSFLLLWSDTAQ